VEADERETGIRAYLNFGHTLGHAIEASDYALLHGEAVALGMRAAARIGLAMGTCDEATAAAIGEGLDTFGLPSRHAVDPQRVLALIGSDKKRARGRQRWVLPLTGGGVEIRDDVPPAVVDAGLDAVRA
jgi:3-dehydroquinate synthetase